jgi:seryl-tRNA synthetase
MIDLRAARSEPEQFREAVARKGAADAFDELLEADRHWLELVPKVDELRGRTKVKGKPSEEQLEELRRVKDELKAAEEELAAAEARREKLLARVPNPPHPDAPEGTSEEDAAELRRWGDAAAADGAREHTEIGRFDMERAARVSGSRFGYIIGDAARVAVALYSFAIDYLADAGFTPVIPPVLVREEAMYGTGFFPSEKSDYYEVPTDGLYLTGTSEVALASLHMGEVLEELPLRYAGFSTNFRREAGAAGKDTRGMFRVHQFNKVEMFVFVEPETSWDEHERLLELEERFVQSLGLPYRVVDTAAGDLGASAARKYDIEAWFPSQGRYREITSCSNTTDYQARRLGIRYRSERGLRPPHTLNGTMVTDRSLLTLLENFGGEVPEVLQKYGAPSQVSR